MRRINIRILMFASAVLFAGCGIIRDYETPEQSNEVQEKLYRDQSDTDTLSIADIPWDEFFTDQLLQQLINEGLEKNNDLQVALQKIAEAQAVFRQSKQNYLPSFNFNPNVTNNHQSKAALNFPSNVNINLRTTTVQLPVGASWELDVWGKLSSTKRSAMASFFKADASARAVQTQLIATIATQYYSLLALDQQLEITLKTLELRKKDLETIEAMKEVSLSDGVALAQTRANVYAAEIMIPDLKRSIRETENALSVLIGRVPGPIERGTMGNQHVTVDLKTGIPLKLLQNRPDVIAAEMAFRETFENVNVMRASFYPTLSISAKAGISALTTNDLLTNSFFTTVSGGLLQPIYNNGINKMNLRRSEALQQQAFFSFQQSLLVAGEEVSNALYAYETTEEKQRLRIEQISALQESVDFTKELLEYSTTTNYLDVITAEQALLTAELAGVNDHLQKYTAIIQLYRALGGGWK